MLFFSVVVVVVVVFQYILTMIFRFAASPLSMKEKMNRLDLVIETKIAQKIYTDKEQ